MPRSSSMVWHTWQPMGSSLDCVWVTGIAFWGLMKNFPSAFNFFFFHEVCQNCRHGRQWKCACSWEILTWPGMCSAEVSESSSFSAAKGTLTKKHTNTRRRKCHPSCDQQWCAVGLVPMHPHSFLHSSSNELLLTSLLGPYLVSSCSCSKVCSVSHHLISLLWPRSHSPAFKPPSFF